MRAVDFGLMLATQLGAKVTLVHAYEIPALAYEAFVYPTADVIDALINAARAQLDKALTAVRQTAPDANAILRQGVPWQQILSAIDEAHADLVVVGTHGRGGLRSAMHQLIMSRSSAHATESRFESRHGSHLAVRIDKRSFECERMLGKRPRIRRTEPTPLADSATTREKAAAPTHEM